MIHGSSFNDQDLFEMTFRKKAVRFISRSWKGEPDLDSIKGTLGEIERFQPDLLIAVGGGSVIDGTKLCRLFYEFPYYIPGMRINGSELKTGFVAVPTTVGSGAEVSSAAVYLKNDHKEMVVLHELRPDVVVYDSRYVRQTLKGLLCESMLDALSHILEGYISTVENHFVEIQAEEGLRILDKEINALLKDEEVDYLKLQYAGYIGGIVQNHCIVGAAHAVAHQMTSFGFSHGTAISLLLPAVVRLNCKDVTLKNRYDMFCKEAGLSGVEELLDKIEMICDKYGINKRKEELKNVLIGHMNNKTFIDNIKNDRGGKGNPIEIDDQYIEELFRSI